MGTLSPDLVTMSQTSAETTAKQPRNAAGRRVRARERDAVTPYCFARRSSLMN